MEINVLIIVLSQILFAAGSFIARSATKGKTFTFHSMIAAWFVVYLLIRFVATILELFVLTRANLGQTVALAGVCGLITANVLGYFLLHETLNPLNYLGIVLAVGAIFLLSFK